jgi:dCMP deaminase
VSKRNKPHPYPFLDRITALFEPFQPREEDPEGTGLQRVETGEPANDNALEVSWDEYFHGIAQAVALKSKDKKRKVGAVIVAAEGNVILSTGFNGFARGIRETAERTDDQAEKLFWVTHAETNAIFNAARHGVSLVDSTMYVTLFPCYGCAQAIVQAGIKRVFTFGTEYWIKTHPDPANRWEIANDLFAEGGVAVDAPNIRWRDFEHWDDEKRAKKKAEAAKAKVTDARSRVRRSLR